MVQPAGEVGGMEQAERRRSQTLVFLAALGRILDQFGRVPFREKDFMAFRFQPLVEQQQLGALPGAIDALDNDQLAGVRMGRGGGIRVLFTHAASS